MIEQAQNIFNVGMNSDDDPRRVQPGEYRYATLMRHYSAFTGSVDGPLSSMTGNTLKENADLETGSMPHGACINEASNTIIVAFYNWNHKHSFWQYNWLTENWTKILGQDNNNVLDFQFDYPIGRNMVVVNGLLYWADGYFESFLLNSYGQLGYHDCRKLNITKAIAYTAGLVGGYSTMGPQILNVAKAPPALPITAAYGDDATLSINNLNRHQFKFKAQFIYDDGEESSYGPESKVPIQQGYESTFGLETEVYLNNIIALSVPTGQEIVTPPTILVGLQDDTLKTLVKWLEEEYPGREYEDYLQLLYYADYSGLNMRDEIQVDEFKKRVKKSLETL